PSVDASGELRPHGRRRGINSNCQRTPCRTEYAKLGEDGERQDAARRQAGERSRYQENHESGSDDWQEHRNDEYGDRGEQDTTYGEAYGKPASKDNADRLASAVSCREPIGFIHPDHDARIYI